jgi:hypothetical protein
LSGFLPEFSPAILVSSSPGLALNFGVSEPRQGSAGHWTLLFRESDRLGVIQRTATPAGEPSPTWVDVVPGAVIEACVKQLSRTTARFPGIRAFFRAAATLITGLFACFFVSHN